MSLQTMYPSEQQHLHQSGVQQQVQQQSDIIGCCALCCRLLEWLGIINQNQQQWNGQRGAYINGRRRNINFVVHGQQNVENAIPVQQQQQVRNRHIQQQTEEQDTCSLLPEKGESSSTPVQSTFVFQSGLPDLETMRKRAAHKRAESKGSAKAKSDVAKDDEVDECCPTCLDPYDEDNPKIITSCGHDFHLACIYEWLNRSDNCPMCGQKMDFDEFQ